MPLYRYTGYTLHCYSMYTFTIHSFNITSITCITCIYRYLSPLYMYKFTCIIWHSNLYNWNTCIFQRLCIKTLFYSFFHWLHDPLNDVMNNTLCAIHKTHVPEQHILIHGDDIHRNVSDLFWVRSSMWRSNQHWRVPTAKSRRRAGGVKMGVTRIRGLWWRHPPAIAHVVLNVL